MSRSLRFRSGLLSQPVLDSAIPSRRTSLDKNSDSISSADDDLFHHFNSDNDYDDLANVDDKSVPERDLLDAVGNTLGNAADGLGDIADTGAHVVSAVGDVATSAVGEVVGLVDTILGDGVSIVKSVATGALPSIISHFPSMISIPPSIIPPLSSIIPLPIPTKDPLPSLSVSVGFPLPLPTDLPLPTSTIDNTVPPPPTSSSINNEIPPPEATHNSFSLPPSSLSIGNELPPVATATHQSSMSSDATSIPHIVTSTTLAHTTLSSPDSSTITTMLPSQSSSRFVSLSNKSFSNHQDYASKSDTEDHSWPSYGSESDRLGGRPSSSPPAPPAYPTSSPGTPNPPTARGAAGIVIGTLVFFLVFAAVGLLWWKRRQNKKGVDMLGRRLELGDTPDAWERIEGGEAFGGSAEKRRKTKEGYRHAYGTMQSGRTQPSNTVKGERRRHLPIITPLLRWVRAHSQSSPHGKTGSAEYAASKGSLPRIRTQIGRRSLSPGTLPSSENASLRSGSFLSSHENDISLYMYAMSDGEDTPLPSPRSFSSMVSQLSRNPSSSSGSTDDGSEDSYNPVGEGKDRSGRRRDSESSEETLDTRSSFGFVRPVVSTTAGTTPSIFTATGHYIMANSSTTTLHTPHSPASPSPSPRTSTRENSSNPGSPYGPGLDFFTARAWRKSQNAGPSLMEVVNSLSPTDSDMQRRNGNDLENRF